MPAIITTQTRVERLTLAVTNAELGHAVFDAAWHLAGRPDDGDADWYTDGIETFISYDGTWHRMSVDPDVARLIDAANILRYGHRFERSEEAS
jgi:hypothetical protein